MICDDFFQLRLSLDTPGAPVFDICGSGFR